ncbi:MAG TPA: glycosyltransferase 87 family protein, partial [Gemmataceae bacterium]|nr:glycosyltransferase 87 family protein [Gemmataceae bacterium]
MAGQLATAVKLFPGLLLVYFLLRGRWKALAAGVATFAAATALAAVVLGPSPCADHLFQVLPGAADVGKGSWPNASATG